MIKKSWHLIVFHAVRLFSGLVVNKILAAYVGPSGVATVGQFRNVIELSVVVASFGCNTGTVTAIASTDQNSKANFTIKQTVISICAISTLACSLVLFLFRDAIAAATIGTEESGQVVGVFSITLWFFLLNQLLLYFIAGENDTKTYARAGIIQNIVLATSVAGGAFFFNLMGALVALASNQVLSVGLNLWICMRAKYLSADHFRFGVDRRAARTILSFSAITLVNTVCVSVSLILIRNHLGSYFGEEVAGYWQAVWQISEYYLGIFILFMSVQLLPTLSSYDYDLSRIFSTVINTILFVFLASLILLSCCFIFRLEILSLLFSDEFFPASVFFKYQLIGDCFKIVSYVFGYYFIVRRFFSILVLTPILCSSSFVCLTILLSDVVGPVSVSISHAITYICYFVVGLIIFLYSIFYATEQAAV